MSAPKIVPIKAPGIIMPGDNLFTWIKNAVQSAAYVPKDNSIFVVAETPVALCQGRVFSPDNILHVSSNAKIWAEKSIMDPRLVQKILDESDSILGALPGLLLTEKNGILIANAGIDKSNSGGGNLYSLWPEHPFKEARRIKAFIEKEFHVNSIGVIISDSRVQMARKGVTGIAIGVAGFEPVIDCRGRKDLFGNTLEFTTRAIADQLADAAHIVMGEADERIPFVFIEDVDAVFTERNIEPDELLMPKEEDLFVRILDIMDLFKKSPD